MKGNQQQGNGSNQSSTQGSEGIFPTRPEKPTRPPGRS